MDRRPGRRVAALIVAATLVGATAACDDGYDGTSPGAAGGTTSTSASAQGSATTAVPSPGGPAGTGNPAADSSAPAVPEGDLVPEVVRTMPHDTAAYTQGYVLDGDRLFESTGQYGESSLREVDPATGEIRRSVPVGADYFAEGLELVDDRLVMLTWREQTAFVYDPDSFETVDQLGYEGEGWGLCRLDDRLVMSDGSDRLTFRDQATFAPLGTVPVRDQDDPVDDLNELECVDGEVWANVWQTDRIVRIDPTTGAVLANVDASGLLSEAERAGADVLNGIAHVDGTDRFLLTGKYWPTVFEVRFVPAQP